MNDWARLKPMAEAAAKLERDARALRSSIDALAAEARPKPQPPSGVVNLNPLLDLIGRGESGGRTGNYNAYYGHARNQKNPDLTAMRIDDVLAWQQLRIHDVGFSAAGRYQIIRKTLLGLVRKHLVDMGRLFNSATQDELARYLLERRGLAKFLRGSLSVNAFANNLAKEWAALPVLTRQKRRTGGKVVTLEPGSSYWAGVAGNKARIKPAEVRKVLEAMR